MQRPNYFKIYSGYANVVNIGGLRIAGISGIYKYGDYYKGLLSYISFANMKQGA